MYRRYRKFRKKPGPKKVLRGHQLKRMLFGYEKYMAGLFGGICLLALYSFFFSDVPSVIQGMMGLLVVISGLFCLMFLVRLYLHNRFLNRFQTIFALREMDAFEFEHYVANLLEKFGFTSKVTKASGDWGVDINAKKDGKNYIVQCKRYAENHLVSSPEMRDFFGTMTHFKADAGIFVTTSRFSPDCLAFAKEKSIVLVDAEKLAAMIAKKFKTP